MPREEKVACDWCDKDLSSTGNAVDWRIVLADEPIPSRGKMNTLLHIRPCLGQTRYFCGTGCLRLWVEKNASIG